MSENKPNVDEQEELDLSSMINEYEEDSDLRRKIESMKKEKELETVKNEVVDSALIDVENTTDIPLFKDAREENITAEDKLGETRQLNIGDADKTLVIMDNERAKVFNSIETEDESVFEYDNKELDEEEITEADIQEFLGEDNRIQDKRTRSMDADKKNKIITYSIIGCIALFVLVAVGFGVKVMLDDKKPVDPPKQEEPKEEPSKPVKPKDEPEVKDPVEEPTPDNSIRIAEIKGIINGYEKNIETLNDSINKAQDRYDAAKKQADAITSEISPIQTTLDNTLTPAMETANKTYSDLVKRFNEGDTSVELEMKEAEAKYNKANDDWNAAVTKIQNLKNDRAPFDQTMKTENDEISNLNTQIKDINAEITTLQNELSALQ